VKLSRAAHQIYLNRTVLKLLTAECAEHAEKTRYASAFSAISAVKGLWRCNGVVYGQNERPQTAFHLDVAGTSKWTR
jgi:hypothetical protein